MGVSWVVVWMIWMSTFESPGEDASWDGLLEMETREETPCQLACLEADGWEEA